MQGASTKSAPEEKSIYDMTFNLKEGFIMENKIMETAKGIFSAKNLKRAGVVAVLAALLAGGGAYWHHEQKAAAKARVSEARTQMIRTQAEKDGVALLSEPEVRTLVADAIGVDETAITYRKIELAENHEQGRKHDDDKHKGDHRDGDRRDPKDRDERKDRRGEPPMDAHDRQMPPPGVPAPDARQPLAAPVPNAGATVAAPASDAARLPAGAPGTAAAPPRRPFQPVYRVKCHANSVKYELVLDAQSGAVLCREIDD